MAQAEDATSARLARDGVSRVTIVARQDAGAHAKLAVADLARCLGKALGVEVPLAGQLSEVKTPLSILVGDDFGVGFGISLSGLQRDGCAIKTRGSAVLITGPGDEGISNGVYTFLMDFVGARWFAPGERYEVIPKNPDLMLPSADMVRNPQFSFRIFSGAMGEDGAAWQRRNRIDTSIAGLPYFGFGHNLGNIVRASIYGKDHPEYFAMIDGRRQVPESDSCEGPQPCLSNPDLVGIAAKAADDFFKKNPATTTFSLCINDSNQFCHCPGCAAMDEPMRKSKGGWDTYSDSYFSFVSKVAKIVKETNPGRYLGCYAYWGVELLPRNIEKLPDNVVVALTQDTSQQFDPNYKKADRDLWLAWSKVAAHLTKYDYYGLGWLTPRFFPHLAAADIKFIRDHSAAGFYCEIYPNWSVTAPQLYMATRLLWDASQDADAILDEYCASLFGRAAPEMKKFYAVLEKYWTRPRAGRWFQGLDNVRPEMDMANETMIDEAWQCLERARPLVIGSEMERVVDVQDHFRFTYSIVKGRGLSRRLSDWKITGRDDLARLVGEALKALEIVRTAESVHAGKWLTNPLYCHTYYSGDRFNRKFLAWEDDLKSAVQTAVNKVSGYCDSRLSKDEAETVRQDLRDRLLADPTARKLGIVESPGG